MQSPAAAPGWRRACCGCRVRGPVAGGQGRAAAATAGAAPRLPLLHSGTPYVMASAGARGPQQRAPRQAQRQQQQEGGAPTSRRRPLPAGGPQGPAPPPPPPPLEPQRSSQRWQGAGEGGVAEPGGARQRGGLQRPPRAQRMQRRRRAPQQQPSAPPPPQQQQQQQQTTHQAPPNELGCPHFGACSGCTLAAGLAAPPLAARAAAFFRGSLGYAGPFPVVAGPATGWRCRAKLAVRGAPGAPALGLFRAGSHEAVDIPECRTHHPRINEAAALLRRALAASRLAPYDEASGGGALRYVQLTALPAWPGGRAEEETEDAVVQMALVVNAPGHDHPNAAAVARLAEALWREAGCGGDSGGQSGGGGGGGGSGGAAAAGAGPAAGAEAPPLQNQQQQQRQQGPRRPLLHSVWLNFQPARGNAILGAEWRRVAGPAHGWQRFGGAAAAVGPAGFVQANFGAMQAAVAAISEAVPRGALVAELYAGGGAIGLALAAQGAAARVTCVELNPACRGPFEAARAALPEVRLTLLPDDGAAVAARARLVTASAGDAPAAWLHGADVVVVDPPRKGLEQALLRELVAPGSTAAAIKSGGAAEEGRTAGGSASSKEAEHGSSGGGTLSDGSAGRAAGPARLVYLSCGYAALERDAAALVAGGWRVADARAFMFFPGTDALETLAVFDRRPV